MTPSGSALWLAAAVLVAAGFLGTTLARLRQGRAVFSLWAFAMAAGSLATYDRLNLSGSLVAVAWGASLLAGCGRREVGRGVAATFAGAAVLYALAPTPASASFTPSSPLVTGVICGLMVHFLGRSGRASLTAALLGCPLAGLAAWLLDGPTTIGGGSAFDAQAVAALVTVALSAAAPRLRRAAPSAEEQRPKV